MRRARKLSLANASAVAVGNASAKPRTAAAATGWGLKMPGRKGTRQVKLKERDLVFILRNLSTLTSSGVSLPKALSTLAEEKALEKHSEMLHSIRRRLENGESFSNVMVNQIKVGEHSGTLGETLTTIARHCEDGNKLKAEIVRKLAYPVLLVCMGCAVLAFLLTYVVPVFKKTYDDAHVNLPFITKVLIAVGAVAKGYGLIIIGLLVLTVVVVRQLRKRPELAYKMDAA